ncbi:uncharacterized protein LOC142172152 [Nicotiana tabacum]|uniref:Uncharacterized protein LOC142172152 n=1 Tax=Nicotiana tabacum TaxID=4097 RepID=A0AC58T4B8_TOBAC
MDLDLALLNDKPAVITDTSSADEKSFHKAWERSNRSSLMFMRMSIANNIKSTISQTESAREYLKFVEEYFYSADKSLAGTLMDELTTMKFDGPRMQNHIIEMTNIAARLQTLGMKFDDSFLEESRLKKQGSHSINLIGQGAGKGLKVKANKSKKKKAHAKASQDANKEHKADTCHFCNKEGHYQKDCLKRKLGSKGKGFLTIQTTNPNKDFLFMGNRMKAPIEGIGTYRLITETGRHLDLLQTLYVPSVSRNLISLSRLDVSGFDLQFGNGCFNLYKNANFYGSGFLSDDLYKLKVDIGFSESLLPVQYNVGIKCSSLDESSAYLWHRRLGHISKKRLERLVKNEILPNLNFTDLTICLDCIKGKQTKHKKSQARDALKVFVNEVERQLDKKVKIIRSDRGGEYYEKYNESGQYPGPFAKFPEECGICAQYTMPEILQQNGVAERVPSKAVPKTPFELWTGRKPSLRHLHVWGCPAEARVYNPQEKKLDSRTISGYFIGYPEKSKSVEIKEVRVNIPLPMNVPTSIQISNIIPIVEKHFDNTEQHLDGTLHEETNSQISDTNEPQEMPLRKYQKVRKSAISDDYVVYLQESDFDIGILHETKDFLSKNFGSLMYAQTCTRPDISFAVGMLGRYQSNPGIDHWKAAKNVLRYLKGTKDYMLMYRISKHLEVVGYSDSDFAGCIDIRKSMNLKNHVARDEGAISWKSAKQSVITTSTMEAEFVACFEATIHALWLRNFISGLGVVDTITKPLKIYCDNSATVFFSKNDKYSKGIKHMELNYFTVKEGVQKQRVSLEHIRTDLMIADPLMKGLQPKIFKEHVHRMGLGCIYD